MIYLDSAAVVKLIRHEPSTAALVSWLNERTGVPLVSSVLVEVEVPRALRRTAPAALPAVPTTLARLYRLEVDATVRATAASFLDPNMRSLDAIHLATAMQVGSQLDSFVTYDSHLLGFAELAGLPVASP